MAPSAVPKWTVRCFSLDAKNNVVITTTSPHTRWTIFHFRVRRLELRNDFVLSNNNNNNNNNNIIYNAHQLNI